MKTKASIAPAHPNEANAVDAPDHGSHPEALALKLKEIQGSFSIEGIDIPDDRMLKYAAEFDEADDRGDIRRRIEHAIKRMS
jgi:hypothetical protein